MINQDTKCACGVYARQDLWEGEMTEDGYRCTGCIKKINMELTERLKGDGNGGTTNSIK